MKRKKLLLGLGTTALALGLAATSTSSILGVSAGVNVLDAKGSFHMDYDSLADAQEAAKDLNIRLSEEGNVLLKNDGTLPLPRGAKVSVFGVREDSLTGGSGSVHASMSDAGFRVNPILSGFYGSNSNGIGTEVTEFNADVQQSFEMYHDAAIIFLSRTGGEGSDPSRVIHAGGKADNAEDADPGEHANAVTGKKHYLELTKSEENLIALVKEKFSTIAVVINTSNPMELGDLMDDDAINGILWIGRPGANGIKAVGEILSGAVNPSGRMAEEWVRDFSSDPTWFNFGDNSQVASSNTYLYGYASEHHEAGQPTGPSTSSMGGGNGYHGIDYEESIYLGYRYYETRYKEIFDKVNPATATAWHDRAVVFPFGYGLSYSSFDLEIQDGIYKDAGLKNKLNASLDGSIFASSVGSPAEVKTIYVPVKVTNTGNVAGKQVVEIYVTAPYTGKVEKSFVTLVGFEKSKELRPGQSQIVIVPVNVQDMASYDYLGGAGEKGYVLEKGDYTIRAMDTSHIDLTVDPADRPTYDEISFNLSTDTYLHLDDFSGNEIKNLFSAENGEFNTVRGGTDFGKAMKNLSRADMGTANDAEIASFPDAPGTADLTITQAFAEKISHWQLFDADDPTYREYDKGGSKEEPWAAKVDIPATWTQKATEPAQGEKYEISFADMAGVEFDDNEKWDAFLNQLSYEEMANFLHNGSYRTNPLNTVGKAQGNDPDGPNNLNSTYSWCDETVISSTWNKDLAKEEGIVVANLGILKGVTGWYGPAMNTNRNPFGGRHNEYYSQDGILGGYIAAAVVGGSESRGLVTYAKHFLINDQETNRNGENCFTWVNEQAFREIYLKPFQMSMQEGGGSAAMSAFARVGQIPTATNYNLCEALTRDEWGWHGFYVTDMYAGESRVARLDLMIRAGHELPLGNVARNKATQSPVLDATLADGKWSYTSKAVDNRISGTWDASKRDGKGAVVVGETPVQSDTQWYWVRRGVKNIMYATANSILRKNGIDLASFSGNATLDPLTQGTAVSNLSVGITLPQGVSANYSISSGELPAGISLNASSGALSGTPTVAGSYRFTVQLRADKFMSATKTFSIVVNSAIAIANVDALKVGEAFSTFITPAESLTAGTNSVAYSITEGVLPAGLALDGASGEIAGTPTEDGDFPVTFNVRTTTGSGRNAKTYNYPVSVTFVVAAAEAVDPVDPEEPVVDPIEEINAQIAALSAKITALETSLEALTDAVEAISYDADIEALRTALNALKATVEALPEPTDTSALSTAIAALEARIAALEAAKPAEGGQASGGCGGSIVGGVAIGVTALAAAFALILKKRKEN